MFIVVFILTILVLVLAHELGHYLAAKRFDVKVLEFGFGLPPRAWGKKIGETIYSINWLPFGGFVRLLGEDEVDKSILDNERSFAAQKLWKRISIVVAGVFMNLLLAWVLFYAVLFAQNFKEQLPLLLEHKFVGVLQTEEKMVLVGEVSADSPAQKANIKQGDRIYAINGEVISEVDQLIRKIKEMVGKEISMTISDPRNTEFREVKITPRKDPPAGQGALGVSLGSFAIANLEYKEPWQKIVSGPVHGYNLIVYSGRILGKTIEVAFEAKDIRPVSQNVAGPIGITSLVRELLQVANPLIPFLNFVAALSLNLAIVNILPFPGLDGGRLLFLVMEGVTRKRTHPTLEKYIHSVGLVILLGLIFLVTLSDIKKFF